MADKTKTIKNATDKELDELLVRLRKESSLQSLIAELKRKSKPVDQHYDQPYSYERPEVSTEEPIESLYHYGILGMRWGVRRERGPDGRVITNKVVSEDHKKAQQLKRNAPKGVSTAELKTLNQRLQLEKQYKDLDPSTYKKGMDVVKGFVAAGTTVTTLYTFVNSPAGQQIIKTVEKKVR